MASSSDQHGQRAEAKRYRGQPPTIPREKELDLFERLRVKRYDEWTEWEDYHSFVREYLTSISVKIKNPKFPCKRASEYIRAKYVAYLRAISDGASVVDAFRIACDSHRKAPVTSKASKTRKATKCPKATKRRKIEHREPTLKHVGSELSVEAESLMREAARLALVSFGNKRLLPQVAGEIGLCMIWRADPDNSWGALALLFQLVQHVDMSSTIETLILELLQTIRNEPAGGRSWRALHLLSGIAQIERYQSKIIGRYDWRPVMSKAICFSRGEGEESHDAGEESHDEVEYDAVQWNFMAATEIIVWLADGGENLDAIADVSLPVILNFILERASEISEVAIHLLMVLIKSCKTKSMRDHIFQKVVQPFLAKCVYRNTLAQCLMRLVKIDWICDYFVQHEVIQTTLSQLKCAHKRTGRQAGDSFMVLAILAERRRLRRRIADNDGILTILQASSTDFGVNTKWIRVDAEKCLIALASDKYIGPRIIDNNGWYSALEALCRFLSRDDTVLWINKRVIKLVWLLLQAEPLSCDQIVAKFVVPMMKGVLWRRPYNVGMLKQRVAEVDDLCSRLAKRDVTALADLQMMETAWQMQDADLFDSFDKVVNEADLQMTEAVWQMQRSDLFDSFDKVVNEADLQMTEVAWQMQGSDLLDSLCDTTKETERKLPSFIAFLGTMAKLNPSFCQMLAVDGLLSLMVSTFLPLGFVTAQADQILEMIISTNDDDSELTSYHTSTLLLTNPPLSPNLDAAMSDCLQPSILGTGERNNSACLVVSVVSDCDVEDDAETPSLIHYNEEDENMNDSEVQVIDIKATNISSSSPRLSTHGVNYWLSIFNGKMVDVEKNGNCLLYASSIATHDNCDISAVDETTLQNLKMEVYTVMIANLLGDVKAKLIDPADELRSIGNSRTGGSSYDYLADLLSYYMTEAKVSVKVYRPSRYWGGCHFLRALAQVKKTPIYVIDEWRNDEAYVQRYMCKTYTFQDDTNHESAWQEPLFVHEAECVFRAYIKAGVIPVMLVLRHSERHFYAVNHGDLRKCFSQGMRERQRDVHRKLNSGWVDPSDLPVKEFEQVVKDVDQEICRRRWM